jgi:putative membrane protein
MNPTALLPIADGWSMHGGGSGWWMAAMIGLMVLFWGAIIVGAVWIARSVGSATPPRQTPTEILDERFAEGALSAEDYEERKRALTGASSAREGT